MFDDILNALPHPALVIGATSQIESANSAALAILGANAVGRNYITIIRQPVLLDAIETAQKSGKATKARYLTTQAGRDMTWLATVAQIENAESFLVSLQDISEMEDASMQRRDFVANVSHELRTPLTALLGFIETLQSAAKDDPAARDRFLSIMESEASRMNRLVDDLLSLNRVETDERIKPTQHVDFVSVVRSVVTALSNLAQDRNVELQTDGLDTVANVNGARDQLSQVVTNLLENAIKYTSSNGKVTVSVSQLDHHPSLRTPAVVLAVEDNGDGIDPIHIPRLTERFYRIDTHRSREQGGTGLGLAIVKHIVNRHRGRLTIESEPGQGSKFSVILPSLQ